MGMVRLSNSGKSTEGTKPPRPLSVYSTLRVLDRRLISPSSLHHHHNHHFSSSIWAVIKLVAS